MDRRRARWIESLYVENGIQNTRPLTRIEILGYRGFRQRGAIDFAVANGSLGSGLTLITGPNNAGKSCILECLRARAGHQTPSFTVGTRNVEVQSVEISYVVNGKNETIKSITKGSSETVRDGVDQVVNALKNLFGTLSKHMSATTAA